jgi:hypothetical protein
MANRQHAFKHRDVVRIVKAARAAGVDVKAVTVDLHAGKITVAQGNEPSDSGSSWDEVLNAQDAKQSS